MATGIGRTGVVGVIRGRASGSGRVIGLRADMDALPMTEATGLPYASATPGAMHACGHDGHTAMLLGAAQYLAETRNFDGTAVVIFQPAEEGGGGGREMVEDGMMERFGIQEVYGMHNMPGKPVGDFAIRPGPMLAASDVFTIAVTGPRRPRRPAAQHHRPGGRRQRRSCWRCSRSSRATSIPLKPAVISVTSFRTDERRLQRHPRARRAARHRPRAGAGGPGPDRGADGRRRRGDRRRARRRGAARPTTRNYPVTVNAGPQADFAARVAAEVVGAPRVDAAAPPVMGAEDFSFMLNARPGAFIFVGNGDTAKLHHPKYDFNDELIPVGCSYWARLVETAMPAA